MKSKVACKVTLSTMVLLAVTACGTTYAHTARQEEAAWPSPHPTPTPTSAADLVLPLDAYDLSASERAEVQRAKMKIIDACMRAFNLRLKLPDGRPIAYPKNAGYLGWLGEDQVAKYGYVGPPGQREEAVAAVTGLRGFALPDSHAGVLMGEISSFNGEAVPAGGCNSVAESQLSRGASVTGAVRQYEERQLHMFSDDAAQTAFEDPRLGAADRAWSTCMKGSEYHYSNPGEAEGDPRWASNAIDETPKSRGTEVEIATATADEACRRQTNYNGVRLAIYADHQLAIIKKNKAVLLRIKEIHRTRLENSRRINSVMATPSW
ncbi:hypothetical protein [Rhizohabitans arisaemae]|uniref:hypothetical protein n=1 Tax=Rhizohabitans arisaemae TaxID=2720610 RepID=UPI0024B145CE|nr:hypothetical protein [Rhizohabitans arisaemae]